MRILQFWNCFSTQVSGFLSLGLRKLLFVSTVLYLSAHATAATKHVNAGNIFFLDVSSNTTNPAITTINVGDTVVWDWVNGTHTVTSGTCVGGSCSPDGLWDSGQFFAPHSFSRTFNTPGTFTYYCTPHLAEMQGTVIVVNPADFTLSISNPTDGNVGGPIFPSQQTGFDGNVVASNGFNSAVSLSCQTGATALPSPCTPAPAGGTPNFSFTITAGAATPGHYSFAAQGTGGTLTHSFPNLNFDVVDFGIAAPSPSSITAFSKAASTSSSTSTSVTLSAAGSLPDFVSLACEPNTLPGGAMGGAACNFVPAGPYSPTASAPVTVSVSIVNVPAGTAAQDYNVLLDATSSTNAGSVTKTKSLTLHVAQFAVSPFTPGIVTIGAGNISNAASTQVTGTNFTGSVALACTAGLPQGGTCSFSPAVVSSFPSSSSVMASVPFNTPGQSPTLTVTATGNSGAASAVQTQALTLSVPAPDFSLGTPSPATVNMVNNSFSQPVTVLLTPTNLAGAVTPSCGSLPTGVSCTFSPPMFVNVTGQPTSFAVIFRASGATAGPHAGITINANATINGVPISHNVALTQLNIAAPGTSTTIASSLAAVNSVTNTGLINVGDPNLTITASVDNSGSTYSAAVWQVNFSNPVVLVASSNPNCSQVLPTAISCNIGDIAVSTGNHYSFKVLPLSARSVLATNVITSPSVGSINLTGNSAAAPAVQIRLRPLARRGLVPRTP